MNTIQTLQEIKIQFDTWRSQRGKHGPFPEELWQSAVNLVGFYSKSQIMRELSISSHQLEDRLQRYGKSVEQINKFIEVSSNSDVHPVMNTKPEPASLPLTSSIELRKPDGTTLVIYELTREDVQALVSTFMG